MQRKVIPIRGSEEEHNRWKEASGSASFSTWARKTLNEAAEAQSAEAKDREYQKQTRLAQLEESHPNVIRAASVGDRKPFRPDFKK